MVTDEQVRLLRQKQMIEGKKQETAAASAGMSVRSARKWQRGSLPSTSRPQRLTFLARGLSMIRLPVSIVLLAFGSLLFFPSVAAVAADKPAEPEFDPAHAEASSELALSGVRGGHIVNAVIDRTFVSEGTRWVVDFKTSPHEGGDLQTFLDEEVKRYEAQLQRYAHLARGLGPQPVRAGLYYPLLSAWREVPLV
jgi:hypothetical protein